MRASTKRLLKHFLKQKFNWPNILLDAKFRWLEMINKHGWVKYKTDNEFCAVCNLQAMKLKSIRNDMLLTTLIFLQKETLKESKKWPLETNFKTRVLSWTLIENLFEYWIVSGHRKYIRTFQMRFWNIQRNLAFDFNTYVATWKNVPREFAYSKY